eukprot:scaffold244656_cov22-Tisochrysis_lutea.AAC.3
MFFNAMKRKVCGDDLLYSKLARAIFFVMAEEFPSAWRGTCILLLVQGCVLFRAVAGLLVQSGVCIHGCDCMQGWNPQAPDMPMVVAIHNSVNERAWSEVGEQRFAYLSHVPCGHCSKLQRILTLPLCRRMCLKIWLPGNASHSGSCQGPSGVA